MFLANFEQKAMEKAREDIAKNMLKDNIDMNAIAKYTGVTLEKIKKFLLEEEKESEKEN